MFDSLADRIKHDDAAEISPRERVVKMALIAVLSIVLFGALYLAVHFAG
ncbi:MAG TPA: hypothetical protein VMG35_18255 [Bryobacteraceae bacterium]|nr:hypothetical protein [Bryobacteraceae bacterium]